MNNSKRKVANSPTVVQSQPSKQRHSNENNWSTNLFDCTNDVPLCCCAFLFLPWLALI